MVTESKVSCGTYCMGGSVELEISDADKCLIAAAPELLQALRALVARNFTYWGGFVCDSNISEDEVAFARAAIAKATGSAS